MTGKERIQRIMNKQDVDRSGFWLGMPHAEALKKYKEYFQVNSLEKLEVLLGNDIRWLGAGGFCFPPLVSFKNPTKMQTRKNLSDAMVKQIETMADLEELHWVTRQKYYFPRFNKALKGAERDGMAVFSGTHSATWHNILDLFGMEDCMIKMIESPELVAAAAERFTDVSIAANESLFNKFGDRIDACFYFNDLGTQLDTMVSLDMFREFFLPSAKRLIDQAKRHKIKVCLHSCGSIDRYIPDLIEAGVDVLHPIQARAKNMEAEHLAAAYGNKIVFMGGLDTQEILPYGTVEDVTNETLRLRNIFGKNFILSPSHEALLANVNGQNVQAMADAAKKKI